MFRRLVGFRRDHQGASLVEFSLVAPLLITMGMGMLEFGLALYGHHVIATGVHDAARYLARFDDPLLPANRTAAQNIVTKGVTLGGNARLPTAFTVNVTSDFVDPPIQNLPIAGVRPYRGGDVINVVYVRADVSYSGFGVLPALGLGSALAFSVEHRERVIHE